MPMGALSTVGPLEIGQREYPLLDVSTESQLLQDATVSASFWGHQGYVAWGPRSPQAQKAVNKLLDGFPSPQQQTSADSQLRRPKRTKPRPLHVQDSHVILSPNGIDPNVRLGTPPHPPISSPINPGPRQSSSPGSPNHNTSLRPGMSSGMGTPIRSNATKRAGLISAAVDSVARSSAQHVSVGRHGKSPATGVKAKTDRKHKGQSSASLTPTTISDWEILLEQNRSRMMSSIEDVTRLIGLPNLGDQTKGAKSPRSGSNTASGNKAKATSKAGPTKPRTQLQSTQSARESKGGLDGSIQVASSSAAASLMAASGGPSQGLPQLYEDAGSDVDAILAPLGPWCGPQALGDTPAPRPWQLPQGTQGSLPQQQQQPCAVDGIPNGHVSVTDPAGDPSGASNTGGFAQGVTAPQPSSNYKDMAPTLPTEKPQSWSSARGKASAQRGSVNFESPTDTARLALLHKLRQEGQAVLDAQQALLYPHLQPPPSQHPTHPYQKFYKPQAHEDSNNLGAPHHQTTSKRAAWEVAEQGPEATLAVARLQQSSAGSVGGRGYHVREPQGGRGGGVHGVYLESADAGGGGGRAMREQQRGWGGYDERSNLSAEASFAEQLGEGHEEHGAAAAGGEERGWVDREGDLLTEASFEVLPNGQHAGSGMLQYASSTGALGTAAAAAGEGGAARNANSEQEEVHAPTTASASSPAAAVNAPTLATEGDPHHKQQHPSLPKALQPDSGAASSPRAFPARSSHSSSGAQEALRGAQARGESGAVGDAVGRHLSAEGSPFGREGAPAPRVPLDVQRLTEQGKKMEVSEGGWDGVPQQQQQQQLEGRDASDSAVAPPREAPSYPYFYSEEQQRQLEEEEAALQEHRQPISEQQQQQLQQELVDAGMNIPRGSRVVGLQTRAVARNASKANSGSTTRASSAKTAREAYAQSDAQEGEQVEQEVVVVLEEGAVSGDGAGQPQEPGMYRTHTMVLPPKHPVLTSGIQYTVVKAVGVPLLRRAEAEEGERVARLAQLEAELGEPRLARQQREGQRAGKALRRMSGTQEVPPPPPQGVSMVRTVQGKRQPSPGPREELPPQPAPFVAPPPMPIPTLSTKPKVPGTNPAPKVPHTLPPIRSGSDREKARTSNSNATTFGQAITDIGKAKMQDVWMS